jgi:hypothetical protein
VDSVCAKEQRSVKDSEHAMYQAEEDRKTYLVHLQLDDQHDFVECLLLKSMDVLPVLVDNTGSSHSTSGLGVELPELILATLANLVGRHAVHATSVSHDGRLDEVEV